MNGIFGEAAPNEDQASFVNQITSITRENSVVRSQVEKNSKGQALKGILPGAVQSAVVRGMTSNDKLARQLLREEKQGLGILTSLVYDLIKTGSVIDWGDFDGN